MQARDSLIFAALGSDGDPNDTQNTSATLKPASDSPHSPSFMFEKSREEGEADVSMGSWKIDMEGREEEETRHGESDREMDLGVKSQARPRPRDLARLQMEEGMGASAGAGAGSVYSSSPRGGDFAVAKSSGEGPPTSYSIPRSSYYVGPPGVGSAYGTPPMGQIGVHYPREIVRIERDYSGGELIQFQASFPLELEGRVTPTQFLETINGINEILISAHKLSASAVYNAVAALTLYASMLFFDSHYEKEMRRLARFIEDLNAEIYNPQGLNILWPRKCAFLFLEIEYY